MNEKKRFDLGIIIPIALGLFSVMGICLVLLIGYFNRPQASVPTEQPATAFKYLFLGTETLTPEPELFTETPEEALTEDPIVLIPPTPESFAPVPVTPTQTDASSGVTLLIPTATPTDDEDETVALEAGKYDDTNSYLEYDGDWISELFVDGVYEETLNISAEIADSVTFTFTGKQIIIGYLGDIDFGTVVITIDDDEFTLDQSDGSEWISPQLTQADHSVIIIHESGDFVNLDYIQVIN